MAKNPVRTIEERRAICKAKYELMNAMPNVRNLLSFDEWMTEQYHWSLTLEQYNNDDTPKYLKDMADEEYKAYRMEAEAYNDLLDDMYILLS